MNLLTTNQKEIVKNVLKMRFFVFAGTLFIFVSLAGIIMLLPSYLLIRSQFLEANLAVSNNKIKDEELLQKTLSLPEEINFKLDLIRSDFNNTKLAKVFYDITAVLPTKVKINSFLISRNQPNELEQFVPGVSIIISGIATDRDSLVVFSNSLKDSKKFTGVEIPVSSLAKDRNLPFSIKLFIKNGQ